MDGWIDRYIDWYVRDCVLAKTAKRKAGIKA